MAFNKNPLVAGNDIDIIEYSGDLENRVESGFDETFTLGGSIDDGVLTNADVKLGKNTLLLEALESLGIDFPVEWGSNYVKWNSGKLEMKFAHEFTNVSVNQAYGNQYQSGYVDIPLPINPTSINYINVQSANYRAWGTILNQLSANAIPRVRFTSPVSTTGDIEAYIEIVGTWK